VIGVGIVASLARLRQGSAPLPAIFVALARRQQLNSAEWRAPRRRVYFLQHSRYNRHKFSYLRVPPGLCD
jgi:hypothetical protein